MQSPKTYESILAGAVPICRERKAAYRRLCNEGVGWPIVIVRDRIEIIETFMCAWWEDTMLRVHLTSYMHIGRLGTIYLSVI